MTGNAQLDFQTAIKNYYSRKIHLHFFPCGIGEGRVKVGQGKSASALTKLQVLTQAQMVEKETIYMFRVCTSVLNSKPECCYVLAGPLKRGKSVGNDISRQTPL